MGAFEFVEGAPSPIDLVVTAADGPATAQANGTMTLQWTDANRGSANAPGPWHDRVWLVSQDDTNTVLPVGEVLVAEGLVLGPGQVYAASATLRVPGGVEGNYLIQVQVNCRGEVFEGSNYTNNTTQGASATALIVPSLPVGGSLSGAWQSTGQPDIYKLSPGADQDLELSLQAAAGNSVLILAALGYVPGPDRYDARSGQFDANVATLNLAQPGGGTYYIAAYPQALNGPTIPYLLAASAPSALSLSSASPTQIPANGSSTIQISGSLLASADTFELSGPNGTYVASALSVPDASSAYASFTLQERPPEPMT